MKGDFDDPKALIREAYNIEAITRSECRSIFLDWALSLPLEQNSNASIQTLLKKYKNTIEAIGITNQRESTVVWERKSGKPIYPIIVWQDRRTEDLCKKILFLGLNPYMSLNVGIYK